MTETFDPDERFSLDPLTGEEVVERVLAGEGADDVSEEPEDEQQEDEQPET